MQGIIDINVSDTIPAVRKIFQSSLSRVFFPTEHDAKVLNCIFVNQAGGIHENDNFQNKITLSNKTHFKFTSQAAEKIYYSHKKHSVINNNFVISEKSHFSYLPQELIFFNQSKLKKNNLIYLDSESSFFLVEQFVMGREFFKEKIKKLFFEDITKLFVDGKIFYTDQSIIDDINKFHQFNLLSNQVQSFANIIFYKKNIKDLNLILNKFFLEKNFSGYSYPSSSLLVCKFIDNNTLQLKLRLFNLINYLASKVLKKRDYLNKNMYF